MNAEPTIRCRNLLLSAIAATLLLGAPGAALAEEFDEARARVDEALRKNPNRVIRQALESCETRRNHAVALYNEGQSARAMRSLKFCFNLLGISETPPVKKQVVEQGPSIEEVQAQAAAEVESALELTPDLENGLEIWRSCAMCHGPEGWGLGNGSVPQVAGQHRKVVIQQLADIRAGNRDNLLMMPYSSAESIGGPQGVADVAGYIDTLEISVEVDKGSGEDLALGEQIYGEKCASCHGAAGEGDNERFIPRIQSQHYAYLVRQFEWIRDGKRRNSNPEMAKQIQGFSAEETHAVLDYVSRLEPPAALQAPPGWRNPDFPN